MHPRQFTIGQLLLIIVAFSIGLAALIGNDLKGIGLSMLMIIGLFGDRPRGTFRRGPARAFFARAVLCSSAYLMPVYLGNTRSLLITDKFLYRG